MSHKKETESSTDLQTLRERFPSATYASYQDSRGSTASNHRGLCCSLTKFWSLAKKKKTLVKTSKSINILNSPHIFLASLQVIFAN